MKSLSRSVSNDSSIVSKSESSGNDSSYKLSSSELSSSKLSPDKDLSGNSVSLCPSVSVPLRPCVSALSVLSVLHDGPDDRDRDGGGHGGAARRRP